MMLRKILNMAAGDLRLALKERSAIFWMFVMPVAFIGLFGGIMGQGGGPRPVLLAVQDLDNSFLSERLIDALGDEGFSIRLLNPAGQDSGEEAVRTLIVPRGFSDSLANGDRVAIRYLLREGGGDDRNMAARVQIYKAIGRLLVTLAEMDETATAGERLRVEASDFQEQYRRLRERPDLIRTVVTTAGRGRTVPTGFAASAPAMLVLFMLMNTVIYGAVLLTLEKQSRCLARHASAPVSRAGLLTGKLCGRLLIAMLQCAVMLVVGRFVYNVFWGHNLIALLGLLLSLGLACASLGLLMGAILSTPEQASAVGWIIPLFLGAIGGTWWPLEIVPPWMRAVAHISPAAWAMDGFHGLISFGKGGEVVIVPCLVLLGFAVVLMAIAAKTLKTE